MNCSFSARRTPPPAPPPGLRRRERGGELQEIEMLEEGRNLIETRSPSPTAAGQGEGFSPRQFRMGRCRGAKPGRGAGVAPCLSCAVPPGTACVPGPGRRSGGRAGPFLPWHEAKKQTVGERTGEGCAAFALFSRCAYYALSRTLPRMIGVTHGHGRQGCPAARASAGSPRLAGARVPARSGRSAWRRNRVPA